jgi:hypothetical protein
MKTGSVTAPWSDTESTASEPIASSNSSHKNANGSDVKDMAVYSRKNSRNAEYNKECRMNPSNPGKTEETDWCSLTGADN